MSTTRLVKAVHGRRSSVPDAEFEVQLAAQMRERLSTEQLLETFARFSAGSGYVDTLLRRACLRSLVRRFGDGISIGRNVSIVHPETIEVGNRVFIGDQTVIQGRFDGRCAIGDGVWIGPQSFFDARDLTIGDEVGWGPGAKVLGSEHIGVPADVPIIRTDLEVAPVEIKAWADVGVNAVILPGVTVGYGAIVGAGSVVTRDVPDFAKVAGVPARVISWRDGRKPVEMRRNSAAGKGDRS